MLDQQWLPKCSCDTILTLTSSMTRYNSECVSYSATSSIMFGWWTCLKMETSLSIMCSFPWHFDLSIIFRAYSAPVDLTKMRIYIFSVYAINSVLGHFHLQSIISTCHLVKYTVNRKCNTCLPLESILGSSCIHTLISLTSLRWVRRIQLKYYSV